MAVVPVRVCACVCYPCVPDLQLNALKRMYGRLWVGPALACWRRGLADSWVGPALACWRRGLADSEYN